MANIVHSSTANPTALQLNWEL